MSWSSRSKVVLPLHSGPVNGTRTGSIERGVQARVPSRPRIVVSGDDLGWSAGAPPARPRSGAAARIGSAAADPSGHCHDREEDAASGGPAPPHGHEGLHTVLRPMSRPQM